MSNVLYFIIGLILAGGGLFTSIAPEEMIYLANRRWFEDPEPTELLIHRTRVMGIIGVIVGIVYIIMAFTK